MKLLAMDKEIRDDDAHHVVFLLHTFDKQSFSLPWAAARHSAVPRSMCEDYDPAITIVLYAGARRICVQLFTLAGCPAARDRLSGCRQTSVGSLSGWQRSACAEPAEFACDAAQGVL